jgi:hypothetical protein
MLDLARRILREGIASVPCPAAAARQSRYKAEAAFEDAAIGIRRRYGGAPPPEPAGGQANGQPDGQANGKKRQQKAG